MLQANLTCTIPWWQLELEGIYVFGELGKGIEFEVSRVAENVPINFRLLDFLLSVWSQMKLRLVY